MPTATIHSISSLKAAATEQAGAYVLHAQLVALHVRTTKTGKEYLDLAWADGSGEMTLKVWSDAPHFTFAKEMVAKQFFEIEGEWVVGPYGIEGKTWQARPLTSEEKATLFAGDPELRARQEQDFADIQHLVSSMVDPRLRSVCELFLAEHGERFRRTAAARDYHHARRGGLVEHTAQMLRSAAALATVYPVNRDLLLAGVLFHDSGKLWENCYPADGFEMPIYEPGEMLGHITLGIELVNKLWRKLFESDAADAWLTLEPSNEMVRMHLLHLIASHHGEFAFGSPVLPKTPEAILLHYVDNIDAKWEMLSETYKNSAKLAARVYERRRPLPHNVLEPLPAFEP
jgi:3'-5' exoribonuclease